MKIVNVTELHAAQGIKALVYGPPGTAKTPLTLTAPRPLYVACETGSRSISRAVKLPAVPCQTVEQINEFRKWLKSSQEANSFDTIAVDSLSQMAEIYLANAQRTNKDGRAAFGIMAKSMREFVDEIRTLPRKHAYLICKLGMRNVAETGMNIPSFPGKDLESFIPHEIDFVWFISRRIVQGIPGEPLAIQTAGTADTMARSRIPLDAPQLNFLEPPHLGKLFEKLMKS